MDTQRIDIPEYVVMHVTDAINAPAGWKPGDSCDVGICKPVSSFALVAMTFVDGEWYIEAEPECE